ncbi:amidase [Mycobacterium sp. Root135]|uniref:amidase n=1 Tax=Mycobacterium sp. Root135 TaxID=1736457 RepID=UPI0006F8D918|nr:amidase family protein [Mycobacterium sp. Root135]KQY08007.1 amidase [Mycobacterium sp. Root135]
MTDSLVMRSAREQLRGLEDREFSARELLDAHVEQMDRFNGTLNAVVSQDLDRAVDAAAAVDSARAAGSPCGPLAGLPMSIKDTHATAGLRTTYGSKLFADNVPTVDDEIVARLRAAGVVVVGKTNVPEMAAGSHTYNPVFGTTVNPYDTSRSVGGSSGGGAAALAAGFQPLSDGSDMGGSLRNPASFCNVVGLRPTPGRVPDPTDGLPFFRLAVAGPMARTVGDVGLMLSAIAGRHPGDPTSLSEDPRHFADVSPVDLRGLRVAWAPTLGGRIAVEPEVVSVLEDAVAVFEAGGARVDVACPDLDGADFVFRTLRAADFDLTWGDLLERQPHSFKADIAWNVRQGGKLGGRQVTRAVAELARLHRAAEQFFDEYDVLLAPVVQVAPFDASWDWPHQIGDTAMATYLDWMAACYLITPLGVPAMSVPAGFTAQGLPVGAQMVTRARSESRLLGIAAAFEELTWHGRRTPPLLDVT